METDSVEEPLPPRTSLYASSFLLLAITPSEIAISLFVLLVLLTCSALLAGSEVAFFSMNYNDISALREQNSPTAQRILHLLEKPKHLLATILVGNNFVNVGIVVVSEFLLHELAPTGTYSPIANFIYGFLPIFDPLFWERAVRFTINVVGVTALIMLFGEVTPKIYAQLNRMKLASFMATPLNVLYPIFRPLVRFLIFGTSFVEKRLEKRTKNDQLTGTDLDEAIELTVRNDESTHDQEVDILKRIIKFGDVTVRQIMRPRVDIVAADLHLTFPELLQLVRESGFSRLPVYDENIDSLTGILYAKDLLGHLFETKDFEWQSLIRTNLKYVPESKKIDDLLKEFQKERLHLAFVVDEYGSTVGIATLEDIMEEVIGEIRDEFDTENEIEYQKINETTYIFEGKTLLNDCCRVLKLDTETFDDFKGDADSLAGMVLEMLGAFPKPDAELTVKNLQLKIISTNKRRIEQIQVIMA